MKNLVPIVLEELLRVLQIGQVQLPQSQEVAVWLLS